MKKKSKFVAFVDMQAWKWQKSCHWNDCN